MTGEILPQHAATLTVGLLWHSVSSDNLGVGALTESQIVMIEACATRLQVRVQYVIFGTKGHLSYAPVGVTLLEGGRVSLKRMLLGRSDFVRDIARCDFVLDIGEGDSFTDIYGTQRFLFLLVSKIAVLLKGKILVLSPQTIGPFDRWWTRAAASFVMRRCERVFARDEQSLAYLLACKVRDNVEEAIDVAFRLPYARLPATDGARTRIGVNVSGLLMSGGYTGKNQFGLSVDYAALVRQLLEYWTAASSNEVWLIPHVLASQIPAEDDRLAIDLLMREFPLCKRVVDCSSPGEAKSVIAAMDFVTGARMHACIAAFSSGVPVVPFAYSRKFNGLFSTLGYSWVVDGKTSTTAQAFAKIVEGFEKRSELALLVKRGMAIAEERIGRYESFLFDTIREQLQLRSESLTSRA